MAAIMNENWLTDRRKEGERRQREGRENRQRILMEGGVGTVDGFDIFVVCGGIALEGLAVVCV